MYADIAADMEPTALKDSKLQVVKIEIINV